MRYALLALLGVIFMAVGVMLVGGSVERVPALPGEAAGLVESGTVEALPPFALEATKGRFDNASLAGRWTFLFFGYTRCPDVCPAALGILRATAERLRLPGAASPAPSFQTVFVSVDPVRDSLDLLTAYLGAVDPAIVGATGTDTALQPLTRALGVDYRRNDATDAVNYTVDHSATLFLISPDGRLVARFPPPQSPERLADELQRLSRQ